MKLLALTFLMILVASCGQSKRYLGDDNGGGDNDFGEDTSTFLSMSASKSYHPSLPTDGSHNLDADTVIDVIVPSSITVDEGNSGNYYSCIEFDFLVSVGSLHCLIRPLS